MPDAGKSIGAEARHRSVLWCATQPLALYIVLAVLAPVTCSSSTMAIKGSTHSPRFVLLTGQ